ncbi:MAG: TetR/AcrR family transcriptional regulator [Arcobacter sp.]|uniref:TetR/AcrR family transcriptional regulator n=1 Tax=Arcobacter sp. TaxID=1872629 RepID=UPI003B0084E2
MKSKIDEKVIAIKKEMYLNATAEYIDKNGYKNLKISQLAKYLELSVGTIYNIFGSKEDLYSEYLILKLKNFLEELNNNETKEPIENLKVYLNAKYKIFIQIDETKNYPVINDPFFFHKLDVINHKIVDDIYSFLQRQFKLLFPECKYDYYHITILFKKFSDGFIESYLLKKYNNSNIVDETIELFIKMFKN